MLCFLESNNLYKASYTQDLNKEILHSFHLDVQEITDYNDGEVYELVEYVTDESKFRLFYCNGILYLQHSNYNSDIMFKVKYNTLKAFFSDYDEYGELYSGYLIDEYLYFNFRRRGFVAPLNECAGIAHISSPLYNKIKHLLTDL